MMEWKNRDLINKSVLHELEASESDLNYRSELVILQETEFQNEENTILIGLFVIISMSLSPNHMMHETYSQKNMQFLP